MTTLLSIHDHWHKFNTNRNPRVVVWKLYPAEQLSFDMALLWNSRGARTPSSQTVLLCFLLVHLALCWFAPFCSGNTCSTFQLQLGKRVLREKGKCIHRARRELTYIDRSPHPWFLIGPSSCKWGSQIAEIWSKRHCLDWSKWGHSDWSVKMLMGI